MSSHGLSATRGFLAARDLLRALRDDHEAAAARFSWPQPEHFNWALDWFDRIAVDNTRVALRMPDPANPNCVTYAELSESSSRVANWLRRLGLRRGQRVLLLLDDQLAVCETMLAVMKLGAVLVLVRATMATADVNEVISRVGPAFVIAAAPLTDAASAAPPRATRICVGAKIPGWRHDDASDQSLRSPPSARSPVRRILRSAGLRARHAVHESPAMERADRGAAARALLPLSTPGSSATETPRECNGAGRT